MGNKWTESFTADLTSAALSKSFTCPYDMVLKAVLIHASEAISETITLGDKKTKLE